MAKVLHESHQAAYDDLVSKFSLEELIDLARRLPFDSAALAAVDPVAATSHPCLAADLDHRLRVLQRLRVDQVRPRQRAREFLAVYCAAACQNLAARVLTEVEELTNQKLAKLQDLKALLRLGLDKHCTWFFDAMRCGGATALRQVKEEPC